MVNNFKGLKNSAQILESQHNSVQVTHYKSKNLMDKGLEYLCRYFETVSEVEKLEHNK